MLPVLTESNVIADQCRMTDVAVDSNDNVYTVSGLRHVITMAVIRKILSCALLTRITTSSMSPYWISLTQENIDM